METQLTRGLVAAAFWDPTRGRPEATVCRDVDGEGLLRLFEATVTP